MGLSLVPFRVSPYCQQTRLSPFCRIPLGPSRPFFNGLQRRCSAREWQCKRFSGENASTSVESSTITGDRLPSSCSAIGLICRRLGFGVNTDGIGIANSPDDFRLRDPIIKYGSFAGTRHRPQREKHRLIRSILRYSTGLLAGAEELLAGSLVSGRPTPSDPPLPSVPVLPSPADKISAHGETQTELPSSRTIHPPPTWSSYRHSFPRCR